MVITLGIAPFYSANKINQTKPLFFKGNNLSSSQDVFQDATTLANVIQSQYGTVKALLTDARANGKPLGEGGFATVLNIPRMPDYVLLVNKEPKFTFRKYKFNTVTDITPGLDVGQSIVTIGNRYRIAKKLSGEPCQIHPVVHLSSDPDKRFVSLPNLTMEAAQTSKYREKYADYTRLAAQMPQEAYDDLAQTLIEIKKCDHAFFDPDPSNVLIDTEKKKFNVVDCERDTGMETESLFGMLRTLLNGRFVYIDERAVQVTGAAGEESVASKPELLALRRNITKKCILAAYHTGLPITESIRSTASKTDDWSAFPWNYEEYLFRISGLQGKWPTTYQLLMDARANNMPKPAFSTALNTLTAPA